MRGTTATVGATALLSITAIAGLYTWFGVAPHTASTAIFILLALLGGNVVLARALTFGYLMLILIVASRTDIVSELTFIGRLRGAILFRPSAELGFMFRYAFIYVPLLFLFATLDRDDLLLSVAMTPLQYFRRCLFVAVMPLLFVLSARDVVMERIGVVFAAIERRGLRVRKAYGWLTNLRVWAPLVVVQVLMIAVDFVQIHDAYGLHLHRVMLVRRPFTLNYYLLFAIGCFGMVLVYAR